MNLIDLFDADHAGFQARTFAEERERRHGLTEDDDDMVAPWIGMCPDESDDEDGSPLHFTNNDLHRHETLYTR